MKGELLSKVMKSSSHFVTEEKSVVSICGISVRRDNPRTGVFMVKSMEDRKRLLSRLGTQILNGNKKARQIAEAMDKYGIIVRQF